MLNKEKRLAIKIKELLNKRGFLVKIEESKKTKSVYLRLDNGACNGIRISNHKNSRTNCKYNILKDYNGKRYEVINGQVITYYNFHSIGRLIADIEIERSNRIIKHGYSNYKKLRDKDRYVSYFDYSTAA